MSLSPGTRLGPYEIAGQIGAGGMGEVYRAHDARLGRDVAIKVLPPTFAADPERLKRFEQEARTVSALNHPNILAIHDIGIHEGSPYLVMELLEGQNLREKLGGRPLPVKKAIEIGQALAQGLAAAHEKGIVHRDLKPENVFITRDGRVKILDFGLAKTRFKSVAEDKTTEALAVETAAGVVMGTVGYMSPEQVRGEFVDARSDLFSIGVILWEMFMGHRPFLGTSAVEIMNAILKEEPGDLDPGLQIPVNLIQVLDRCLAKDPAGRFHSAYDLAFTLQTMTGSGTSPSASIGRNIHLLRRRPLALALGIALGCVALASVLAGHLLRGTSKSGPVARYPNVVVLPAKVLGTPDSAFLTDAIPDTLTTFLGNVAGLEMKLPPSSLQLEKAQGDLAKITTAYQADYLVLSTVTAQGENLALNVKVAEAGTQKVRWAGQFQGTRNTYNEIARQAAEGVAQALRSNAAPILGEIANSEVALALAEGKHFLERYGQQGKQEDFEYAKAALERALNLAPGGAEAPARMGMLWRHRFTHTHDPASLDEAETWARRAVGLAPRSPEAWLSLMWVEMDRNHSAAAMDCAWKRFALDPRSPRAHAEIANMASLPGSMAMELAAYRRALTFGPPAPDQAPLFILALDRAGKAAEALQIADRALALDPDRVWIQLCRGLVLVDLGRLEEAERTLQTYHSEAAGRIVWVRESWQQIQFALVFARGDAQASRTLAKELVTRYLNQPPDGYTLTIATPILVPRLVRLGMADEALCLMQKTLELGQGPNLDWLYQNPDVQKLWSDPRFPQILKATQKACAIIVKNFDAAKARGELPSYLEQPLAELREMVNRPI